LRTARRWGSAARACRQPTDPNRLRGVDINLGVAAVALSTAAPGGRVFNQYGAVTIIVQGAEKNPEEIARLVKAEFIRGTLAESGREDLF
jgi:hypothetical protein